MSLVQLVSGLEKFSLDILGLGFIVCGVTSIVKKFVPDSSKKYLTFLPFILGIIIYMGYLYFTQGEVDWFAISNYELGLKCGIMATIYYVIFEQFIRTGTVDTEASSLCEISVSGQLSGIILDSKIDTIPKDIIARISTSLSDTNYCINTVYDMIKDIRKSGVEEQELINVSNAIVSTIKLLHGK